MPRRAPPHSPSEEALGLSNALRSLRERGGMTQDQAAAAIKVTRQAWQQYETAGKPLMLRTDMQERLSSALGLHREDLLRERDRLAGIETELAHYREPARVYELPILGRVRASPAGPQIYDLAEPEGMIDLEWLFGPNVRSLRVAGDSMTGYVESGQLVIYDVSIWPRRGEGCIIELQNGEVYVKEYEAVSQGVLRVKQRFPEETVNFPMTEVKGVYQIRFRGG